MVLHTGDSDLQAMFGLISRKKNRRVHSLEKTYNSVGETNSPKYDAGRHHEEQVARNRAAQKNSPKAKKSSSDTTALPRNPELTAGYQPGSLEGIIRPVGSFKMPGDAGDFGPRKHPVTGRYSYHTGLDMSESAGTNIYAAASGIVDTATYNNIYGNEVVLFHGQNKKSGVKYDTMYGHMQTLLVHPGQKVAQGDLIGHVGETGLATGNHLHFETWEQYPGDKKGTPVNPLKYLTEFDKDDLKKRIAPRPNAEATAGKGNRNLEAFLNAISEQESGGSNNYQAVGVPTRYGTAYGKYQVLDSNIKGPGGWDKEYLGKDINVDEFLHTPQEQEQIARGKLTDYFNQYGPGGAAKAWYGGPGVANLSSNKPQYGGPSINQYSLDILRKMDKYL